MGLLHFMKSPSFLWRDNQHSCLPRLDVNFVKRQDSVFSARTASVQTFSQGWPGKQSSEAKSSQYCLPPPSFSPQETRVSLSTPDSGMGGSKPISTTVSRKLRRLGRRNAVQSPGLEQKNEVSSKQGIRSSPIKKIKVGSGTWSSAQGLSAGMECTDTAFGRMEPDRDNSASDNHPSNRKRRLPFHWEKYAATCVVGAFGFKELLSVLSRNINGTAQSDYAGGGDSGGRLGSGGGWNGMGGGGDNGGGGPGGLNPNSEGFFTDLELLKDDMEEEDFGSGIVDYYEEQENGKNRESSTCDQSFAGVPLFTSLNSAAADSLLEKNSYDKPSVGCEEDYLMHEGYEPESSSGHELPFHSLGSFMQVEQSLFHGHGRAVLDLNTETYSSFKQGFLPPSGGELDTIDVDHDSSGEVYSNVMQGSLPAVEQEVDKKTSSKFGCVDRAEDAELVEKLKALDLEFLQPSISVFTDQRSQCTDLPMNERQQRAHNINGNGSSMLGTSAKVDASGDSYDRSSIFRPSAERQTFLHGNSTNIAVSFLPESFSAIHVSKWSQDMIDWLSGLVHSVIARTGGQRSSFKEKSDAKESERKTLVDEVVSLVLKQLAETERPTALAKHCEIEALRRLQQETFLELLKLREHLDKVEQFTGLRRPNYSGNSSGVARTQLKGEVKAGTAFVMLEENSSRHSRSSLQQAGIQTGLDVRFTFETPFRERDLLVTQCVAGQGSSVGDGRALGGPISLQKVHYLTYINDDFSLSVVPLGAQGKDVTEIINPLQDQALTEFAKNGPALFNHCKGSAVGGTVNGSNFALSIAQYLSGWGNQNSILGSRDFESDPFCLSTLGQFLFQPSEWMIFSLSVLNRYWPSPPLPSSMGLHWSEIGPLILPAIHSQQTSRSTVTSHASTSTHNSFGSMWGAPDMDCCNGSLESKGTAMQSVAVAAEVELGAQVSIGGWTQIDRGDWLHDADTTNLQWALSLAKTSGTSIDWGVSIGGSRPDFWSMATSDQEGYPGYSGGGLSDPYGTQLQLEAYLKLHCGRGFTLQPGLLYLMNKHSHTPALMLRSSWTM